METRTQALNLFFDYRLQPWNDYIRSGLTIQELRSVREIVVIFDLFVQYLEDKIRSKVECTDLNELEFSTEQYVHCLSTEFTFTAELLILICSCNLSLQSPTHDRSALL